MANYSRTLLILGSLLVSLVMSLTAAGTDGGLAYPVDFTYSVAMGHEPGVTRRDPSDVIKVGDEFYYKGRMKGKGPGETKMGVAFADSPTGPFTKQGEALHAGHEVMVWPQGKGAASMATASGPRMVYYAADGLHFEPRNAVRNPPQAPGAWRSDDFENNPDGKGLEWGISHVTKDWDLYLMRFDCRP